MDYRRFVHGAFLPAAAALLVSLPRAAEAYIDPGLAGPLFQLSYLALFVSLLVVTPVLFFWKRIARFVRGRLRRLISQPGEAPPQE